MPMPLHILVLLLLLLLLSGEALPEDMYQRLKAAKTFRSGTMMLRQVATPPSLLPPSHHTCRPPGPLGLLPAAGMLLMAIRSNKQSTWERFDYYFPFPSNCRLV
jgi:Zn-dependent oligopeptidase